MHYTINTSDQLKPILVGFRKTHELSQTAMADKLGVSQQTYQVLESKPHKVTIDRLLRVLSILGVKLVLSDQVTPERGYYNQLDHAANGNLAKEPDRDSW